MKNPDCSTQPGFNSYNTYDLLYSGIILQPKLLPD